MVYMFHTNVNVPKIYGVWSLINLPKINGAQHVCPLEKKPIKSYMYMHWSNHINLNKLNEQIEQIVMFRHVRYTPLLLGSALEDKSTNIFSELAC